MKLWTYPTKERFLVWFLLACLLPIGAITCILIVIIRIPLSIYYILSGYFKNWVASCSQRIRREIKLFDHNGLRHSIDYLNKRSTLRALAQAGIQEQAEYVDLFTKRETDNPEFDFFINTEIEEFLPVNANCTAIGNLAYLALHHRDESIRENCKRSLNDIAQYYQSFN